MDLWRIFVMATLRVNLNWDYDRLQHMVNEHKTIRKMLGHGFFDDDCEYSLQTLKDQSRDC
jgi:IS5 family transposase